MRTTQQMSITLPTEMAKKVKAKVASGDYASESEVIREGLRALEERDSVIERCLHGWTRRHIDLGGRKGATARAHGSRREKSALRCTGIRSD